MWWRGDEDIKLNPKVKFPVRVVVPSDSPKIGASNSNFVEWRFLHRNYVRNHSVVRLLWLKQLVH